MEVIRGLHNIRPEHKGSVVTMGNFDGVHLGHQKLLMRLLEEGKRRRLPTTLITFEPQPLEYFLGEQAPPRLTRFREKLELLQATGVARVLCLPFNKQLAQRSADFIAAELLLKKLGTAYILVGDDFHFGADRQGDFALLQRAGAQHGFASESHATVLSGTERISSSLIRRLLAAGDIAPAEALLGHPYVITGRAIHGRKLGRTIGVPTANIRLSKHQTPLRGVFAVAAEIANQRFTSGQSRRRLVGLANIGMRPTVQGDGWLLEVHLFDFDESIYGQRLRVRFLVKIRAEQKFDGIEALRTQVQKDIEVAKRRLQEDRYQALLQEPGFKQAIVP